MQTDQTPTEGNHSANQNTEGALDGATCSPSVCDTPETNASFPLSTNWYYPDTPEYLEQRRVVQKLERERNQLHRWKDEAMVVLDRWESVWIAAGKPGHLGSSKADEVHKFILENSIYS